MGDVDPAYGQGGLVKEEVLPLADGGALRAAGGRYARLDAAGLVDANFGSQGERPWPIGFTPNWAAWLRLQDGSILLGGSLSGDPALLRMNAAGEIDPQFAGTGMRTWVRLISRGRVEWLAVQQDGRVLVMTGEYHPAPYFETPLQVAVRRLNADMGDDATFGSAGIALVKDYSIGSTGILEVSRQEMAVLHDGRIQIIDGYSSSSPAPGISAMPVRVEYLDADGRAAQPPAVDTALDPVIREWRVVHRFADGRLLVDGYSSSAQATHYRLILLGAGGAPDPHFGTSGGVTLTQPPRTRPVRTNVCSDESHLLLLGENENETLIVRVLLQGPSAGQLDSAFGRQGIVTIKAALGAKEIQCLTDGSALISGSRGTFRLLATASPSPGIVSFATSHVAAFAPGQANVQVTRSAGTDGAISVDFATVPIASGAVQGRDFFAASGRLEWAHGDGEAKSLSVDVLPEYFVVAPNQYLPIPLDLTNPAGGTFVAIGQTMLNRRLPAQVRNGAPARLAGTVDGVSPTTGGGGSTGALALMVLALAISARVRRDAHRHDGIVRLPRPSGDAARGRAREAGS